MAVIADLDIDQGSDFVAEFTLENDDESPMLLVGAQVYSQFRKNYSSNSGYNFNASIIDEANGKITIHLAGSVSTNIRPGRYLYDIEILSQTGIKTRVVEGIITINPEITRIP